MPALTRSRSQSDSSSTRQPRLSLACPVPNCTEQLPHKLPSLIQTHLTNHHSTTEIRKIPSSFFQAAGVFKCPICPAPNIHLTSSQPRLTSHINTKHKKSIRSTTNTEIATTHFPHSVESRAEIQANWKKSFQYLHKLDPKPCKFRKSVYHKLKYSSKSELHDICNANIFYFKCKLQYHTSRGHVTH